MTAWLLKRIGWVGMVLGLSLWGTACKRRIDTTPPEVWDEAPPEDLAEANKSLAPDWNLASPQITTGGLQWIAATEPSTHVTHLRLFLPTDRSDAVNAVLGESIRHGLARRLAGSGIRSEVTFRPGRIEVATHSHQRETATALKALFGTLSRSDFAKQLQRARDRVRKRLIADRSASEVVIKPALEALTGRVGIDAAVLETLDHTQLTQAWSAVLHPEQAVLVTHTDPSEVDAIRSSLRTLPSPWSEPHSPAHRSSLARLRQAPLPPLQGASAVPSPSISPTSTLPTDGDAAAPKHSTGWVLGRRLITATPQERASARLAQRILQENVDARLVIAGEEAVLLIILPLPAQKPAEAAQAQLQALHTHAITRQPRQRLLQASDLWLGARMVQASLDGEDWTALWSESLDLASEDRNIPIALSRDAGLMLNTDGEQLLAWQKQWLDPLVDPSLWRFTVFGGPEDLLGDIAKRWSQLEP